MKFRKMSVIGAVLAGMLATSLAVATPVSAAAAPPPWEPDAQANGTVSFFNAAGTQITGGSDLSHLFDYAAVSSAEDPAGFHKAFVAFAFPDHAQPTFNWFVQNASAATTYPNATAPAPINTFTNPVSHPGPNDANLTAALGAGVLDTTPGYANVMQVRVAQTGGTGYWAADISYDTGAGTWTQIYPTVVTAASTTTTLAASPVGHQLPGGAVDLTATVSPSAAGTVQFRDGATDLGSPVVVTTGTASLSTSALTPGVHSITAAFTPTDPSAFAASTSAATSYVVGTVPAAPTNVTAAPGNTSASVSWAAPGDTGGVALTGYDVQFSANGGAWTSASASFNTSTATSQVLSGLANGASYQFRVAAINQLGVGAYSAPSAAVAPVADSSVLVAARSVAIKYGAATTISARLVDATTAGVIAGVPVYLFARTSTSQPFAFSRALVTDAAGTVALGVRPISNTQYQWVFPGDATHAAATSGIESVSVSRVVSARATAARLRHGTIAKLYGGVLPSRSGQYVYLQQLVGRTWRTVAKARIIRQKLPNGRVSVGYVFTLRPPRAGRYSYHVLAPATSTNIAGASGTLKLTVF